MNLDDKCKKLQLLKKFLDRAIEKCEPTNGIDPSMYYFRGLLSFQLFNFYEALTDFNRAIGAEAEVTAAFYLARGRAYACVGLIRQAMRDLTVAIKTQEGLGQAYRYRALCFYLIGDTPAAFKDF